jgi:hypothetical protein
MTPATQNLNSKLSTKRRVPMPGGNGLDRRGTAIRGSAPPVRIAGSPRPYQGGYRIDV